MTYRLHRTLAWTPVLVLTVAFASIAAVPSTQPAATQPSESSKSYQVVSQREDRLIVRLPNRMLVAVQEIHTAPVVSVQCWVKTGSIYEQEHVGAGLSHFLEHLLSAGSTSTRSEEESNAILGAIGAQTNASTSLDTVRYYVDTTSDHADTAVDLVGDWMRNSLISEKEYQRERQVIQREFEHGDGDPGRIFWKLTLQARYGAHPARHPTIGYLDEFLRISRDEIYDFYKRMYVPNNMLFVVAGDIDKQKMVDRIAATWSSVPVGKLPDLKLPEEAAGQQAREVSRFASINQPKVRLIWPGTRLAEPHDYALDVLAIILGEGESSRLVHRVRDEQQAVSEIDAYNRSFEWGRGFFGIDADAMPLDPQQVQGVTPEQANKLAVDRAKAAIIAEVQRVRAEGVTDDELVRAKRKVLASAVSSTQSAHGFADRLAGDLIGMGDPDYLAHYAEAIQQVTRGQVLAAATEFIVPERLITVMLLPAPKDYKSEPLKRPENISNLDSIPSRPVVLDNVVLFDRISKTQATRQTEPRQVRLDPIQRFVMPNGLRLLVQRSTLVPAVSMQMYSMGGLLADAPGREGIASATAELQMKGTATLTADELAARLDNLGAELNTGAGNNTSFVQAKCLSENWQTVLAMLADVALRPTFPDKEWARYQPRRLTEIAQQTDRWMQELGLAFRPAFFGESHPWSQSPLGRAEVVAGLTTEQMRTFHQRHLSASQTVLAIFGDVDPDAVAKAVESLFRDLPAKPATPFDPAVPPAPHSRVVTVPTQKRMAAVQVGFGPGATRRSPDYPALSVLAKVISDFPSGWLENELRGGRGQGLAYAVWAHNVAGVMPGYFAVGYNTDPAQVNEALMRTMKVVERARETVVDQTTLERAKSAVLADEFLDKQTNSERAVEAALNELYGLGLDEPRRFMAEVKGLTPEVLQIAARLYLQNPVTVILLNQSTLPATQSTTAPTTQP